MAVQLRDYQLDAVKRLKNGNILCGGVGTGKSRTALAYYYTRVCKGQIKINDDGFYIPMESPRDLYIITTAKKRDTLEWDKECSMFALSVHDEVSQVKVVVDSWNNIKKYKDVYGAFFIFDEQRLVGSGAWVKTFYNIARKNQWILLTATPGDVWKDYIPVFVANGFYRNKTEFESCHCVFSPYTKYKKVERYYNEARLESLRSLITVHMVAPRQTVRHDIPYIVEYDKNVYKTVMRDRWNPWDDEPIQEASKYGYLLRRAVNDSSYRIDAVNNILSTQKRAIIFYNFTYELRRLRDYCENQKMTYSEWNGEKHEPLPEGDSWVYLVQYSAGAEGWNCVTTDTIIFFSQNHSYRILEQAAGRIDRMNTPYTDLYYYHLRSRAPIDLTILRAIREKRIFNERAFSHRAFISVR